MYGRRVRRVFGLLVSESAAIAALVTARGAFAPRGRVDDELGVALWLAALAVSAWLLVSTVGCIVAEGLPGTSVRVRELVGRLTLPAVHRMVLRAHAVGVAGTLVLGSAVAASTHDRPPSTVRSGREVEVVEPQETEMSVDAAPASTPADEHRVVPGENLWSIAAAHLAAARGQPVGDPDIARYWVTVVDANRARLRSADPDLIYPGELVTLPPPSR